MFEDCKPVLALAFGGVNDSTGTKYFTCYAAGCY